MRKRIQGQTILSESRTAVITGAAGGLGACFARKLASQGYGLLLIDRREEPLNALCDELTGRHDVGAEPLAVDLTNKEAMVSLAARLAATHDLEMLVNNAGFGVSRFFADADVEQHLDMIRVHVLSNTRCGPCRAGGRSSSPAGSTASSGA